jgi:hypothetical protein
MQTYYYCIGFKSIILNLKMSLRDDLLREYSKAHVAFIAKSIGPNQEDFDELITLFLGDEYRVTQRAAWVLSHCADEHPWLIEKHIEPLLLNLQKPVGDPVKRNTLRVLRNVEIPEELMGIAADLCFDFLLSGKEPVAVKIHAMTILHNIVKKFPELKEELKVAIEDQMPFGSAGFKNRGGKVLKAISKMS